MISVVDKNCEVLKFTMIKLLSFDWLTAGAVTCNVMVWCVVTA